MKQPLNDAMVIHVVGKQWMWKIQHPEGTREINELHVPIGRPVKLILTSQDVIHDFSIPAFRIKQDVVPGSYVTEWFTPTRVGEYHLFCSQYCGTGHAQMVGSVMVMNASDYQAWLAGIVPAESPAASGYRLFTSWGCAACHGERAPTMAGLYMSQVLLSDGSTVVADEDYLRESIIEPAAKIVAGYPADHAELSEAIDRRTDLRSDRVHQEPAVGSDAAGQQRLLPARFVQMPAPSTQPVNGYSPRQLAELSARPASTQL